MPTLADQIDLLKDQRFVSPEFNQSCIILRFAEPIPRYAAAEFLRIHLTKDMLARGEDAPFKPEIFQPDRVGLMPCATCGQTMARLSLFYTKCTNPKCRTFGHRVQNGPVQGVVDVLVFDEFITDIGTATEPARIDRALLVLDRRYDDAVLQATYRTAGALCEFNRWKLTNA